MLRHGPRRFATLFVPLALVVAVLPLRLRLIGSTTFPRSCGVSTAAEVLVALPEPSVARYIAV